MCFFERADGKDVGEADQEGREAGRVTASEQRTGRPVVTAKNAAQLNAVVTGVIEAIAEPPEQKK